MTVVFEYYHFIIRSSKVSCSFWGTVVDVLYPQHMVVEVLQQTAPLPENPVEQELSVELQPHPTNSSQLSHEPTHGTPCDTSDDHEHLTTQACVSACSLPFELLF